MRTVLILTGLMFFGYNNLIAQKYISNRQSYMEGNSSKSIYLDETRYIRINGNQFEVELPDNSLLKGTLTLISDETKDGKRIIVYKTDKGCILVINSDNIFLNLYKTNDIAYTYYLDNYIEPTEKEKQEIKEKTEYEIHVKQYGKLSADCIKDGVIRIGMSGLAVLLVKGTPLAINQTETENLITEQLVYNDMYIYLENGTVSAIQRTIKP